MLWRILRTMPVEMYFALQKRVKTLSKHLQNVAWLRIVARPLLPRCLNSYRSASHELVTILFQKSADKIRHRVVQKFKSIQSRPNQISVLNNMQSLAVQAHSLKEAVRRLSLLHHLKHWMDPLTNSRLLTAFSIYHLDCPHIPPLPRLPSHLVSLNNPNPIQCHRLTSLIQISLLPTFLR